ncbi:hypothetical protein [Methylovirgula sp. HY1]|uniref:hypothetical protein n=1 Tax=Methylovirgula sp. HY1 TaxID=2822761 RepID=UPI001C5ABC98|nr:hypothetical protein [Methylovirgula sp. HY1]
MKLIAPIFCLPVTPPPALCATMFGTRANASQPVPRQNGAPNADFAAPLVAWHIRPARPRRFDSAVFDSACDPRMT